MIRTGQEYRPRLREDREIWIDRERVRDVTTHPTCKPVVDVVAKPRIDFVPHLAPVKQPPHLVADVGEDTPDIVQISLAHEPAAAAPEPASGGQGQQTGPDITTLSWPEEASMHDTAYEIGRLFFETYVSAGDSILDIGSMDINGSLRDFRPEGSVYLGIDLSAGNSVDVVVRTNAELPFAGETFNVVVSTSCFEHDMMFWQTFLEMCRVLRQGGYIYVNAPSKGDYHQYPFDAWRFFPDAGIALRDWAKYNNKRDVELLESFITENNGDIWNDCVMIFGKGASARASSVSERYPLAMNIRRYPNLTEIKGWLDRW